MLLDFLPPDLSLYAGSSPRKEILFLSGTENHGNIHFPWNGIQLHQIQDGNPVLRAKQRTEFAVDSLLPVSGVVAFEKTVCESDRQNFTSSIIRHVPD